LATRIVHPEEFELAGIFLIKREDLIALDTIFDDAERQFAKYSKRKIEEAAKKSFGELSYTDSEIKKVKEKIKSSHPFNRKTREIEVHCQSKKRFSAKTFCELIADPVISNEKPLFATATLRDGEVELKVKILGQFFENQMKGSISSSHTFAQDIFNRVKEWAASKSRFEWYRKLVIPVGTVGFVLTMILLSSMSQGIFTTLSDKSEVINDSKSMLIDGLQESEIPKPVETLLKIHVNDFTTTTVIDVKPWYISLLLVAVGLMLFSYLCPKSTLGFGGHAKRVERIEFLTGKLWVAICAWIFAILTSAMGSILFEFIFN
jgi:hypothetical protein